jgi:short-subunit dehydrogenase
MLHKVVVVVGATGGIGSALVPKLAESGAKLVLVARDADRLDELIRNLEDDYETDYETRAIAIPTDITQYAQVELMVQKAIAQFGQIDVLINAAGAGVMKQFLRIEPQELDQMLDLNLKGNFYTSQAVANVMKDRKIGHICNVIGILGKHPMAMAAAYCASKFGVVGFSKSMADELRRFGIKRLFENVGIPRESRQGIIK